VFVVEILEVIDVDHRHADGVVFPFGTGGFPFQRFVKVTTVV
jgi:hypothetical protein